MTPRSARPLLLLLQIIGCSLLMVACLKKPNTPTNTNPGNDGRDRQTAVCDPATQTCPNTTLSNTIQTSFSYTINKNGTHKDASFQTALKNKPLTLHAPTGYSTTWEVQINLKNSGTLRTHLEGLFSESEANKKIEGFTCTHDASKHQYSCTNDFNAPGTAHMRVKAMDVGHCKKVNASSTSSCDAANWHSTLTNNASYITLNIPVTVHRVFDSTNYTTCILLDTGEQLNKGRKNLAEDLATVFFKHIKVNNDCQ